MIGSTRGSRQRHLPKRFSIEVNGMATPCVWLGTGLARTSEIPWNVRPPGAMVVPLMKSPQKGFPRGPHLAFQAPRPAVTSSPLHKRGCTPAAPGWAHSSGNILS